MVWACERREDASVGRWVLEIELPGKRKMGRPKRTFIGAVKGMRGVGATQGEVHDRRDWRRKIRYGNL